MTDATKPAGFYADFAGLAALKKSAAQNDPKAVREAARQFESLFTRMMLKSMREASANSEDAMFNSKETQFYQGMYDDQLAVQLSKGKGLGLADMLVQQLTRAGLTNPATAEKSGSAAVRGVRAPTITSAPAATSANDTTSSSNTPAGVASSPEDFVQKMWPYAQEAAQQLGVDPHTLIAHAALETGWGRSVPTSADGTSSNNLFGIKATGKWQGGAVASRTVEFEGGVAVNKVQQFRAYSSPAQSFKDYAAMIGGSTRYAAARDTGNNSAAFASALQQGGYATDPAYAQKLAATATRVQALVNVNSLKANDPRPLTAATDTTSSIAGGPSRPRSYSA
jgi:peptidoglycan hydrolase FlgJ